MDDFEKKAIADLARRMRQPEITIHKPLISQDIQKSHKSGKKAKSMSP